MHINPDHFLTTPLGRVVTSELNAAAWLQCYKQLELSLGSIRNRINLYVLVGTQGSGKSTWAKNHLSNHPFDIVFDAILVTRSERQPILQACKGIANVTSIAVHFTAPLELCLQRNGARPRDEIVAEQAVRNVFSALEPPSLLEGFTSIHRVLD